MKTPLLLLLAVSPVCAIAASRSSVNYSIAAEIVDTGGVRATSANYTNDGSAAVIAGISAVAAPVQTAKHGYASQLYEIAGLTVTSATPNVNEGDALQLAAWQLLDDATFLATDANAVTWSIASGPLASISASGLATAGLVFENTPATVQGTFGGFTGSLNFTVLDSIPDNFGAYAGDGIGDDWQVQYFGLDNPAAAPGVDFSGSGQTNLFKYAAGLDPLDANSRFTLTIRPVPGQPNHRRLTFSPRFADRDYAVKFKGSLSGGAWDPLVDSSVTDNGQERTVTDLSATNPRRFYEVEITKP